MIRGRVSYPQLKRDTRSATLIFMEELQLLTKGEDHRVCFELIFTY
jgi:hypothetical protein